MRSLVQTLLFLMGGMRAASASEGLWSERVQPILDRHCVKCHGPLEQKSGLALDTPEAAFKGDDDGPVVVAGQAGESRLVRALDSGADPHMPPKKQLTDDEIAAIRDWVDALTPSPAAVKSSDDVAREPRSAPQSIDDILAGDWRSRGLTPAPLADDRTFIRRASLDLIGRIPMQPEAEAFLLDAAPDKRATFVDRLLASDEAARYFREVWDALLMGRRGGGREERRREAGWFAYLEDVFRTGRPWNEVVAAIICARPEAPADRGAVWFLFERRNDHQQIAESIAPVIYGTRVDCAQCHDHPLAREIKQAHYWGLVAAFNRSKNIEQGPPAVAESAIGGFINYSNLKKESQPAVLTMLTGTTIDEARPAEGAKEEDGGDRYLDPSASVKVPRFSRRARLAQAATEDNPLLARSFVNHTWALLMGRGIVHPVDEMNSKNPPSHSELLNWLAQDFAGHRYDVKRLIRMIVLSRTYQLAAWSGPGNAPPADAFAAAIEKPLTAEAIARSARVASGRPPGDDALRLACIERFPDVLPRVTRATIQQAMFLANGDAFGSLFAGGPGVDSLAAIADVNDRVRAAFRQALLRDPDTEEFAKSLEFLSSHSGPSAKAVGDLLWSLVSGPEFLTNH